MLGNRVRMSESDSSAVLQERLTLRGLLRSVGCLIGGRDLVGLVAEGLQEAVVVLVPGQVVHPHLPGLLARLGPQLHPLRLEVLGQAREGWAQRGEGTQRCLRGHI